MKNFEKIIMVMMLTVICLGTSEVKALILNDGGVHTIDYQLDDNVWVEDSLSDEFTTLNLVDGGIIRDWINVFDYSQFNMSGGSIEFELFTWDNSQAYISSGSIAYDLNVFHSSNVSIYGGTIGDEVLARDFSEITIYGSGFMVDGIPVDYGPITMGTINELGMLTGTLTGILQSGDPLDNVFYIQPDAAIFLLPEPATMLLVGLGGLILRAC
jgi:hypothetical protein